MIEAGLAILACVACRARIWADITTTRRFVGEETKPAGRIKNTPVLLEVNGLPVDHSPAGLAFMWVPGHTLQAVV